MLEKFDLPHGTLYQALAEEGDEHTATKHAENQSVNFVKSGKRYDVIVGSSVVGSVFKTTPPHHKFNIRWGASSGDVTVSGCFSRREAAALLLEELGINGHGK